MYQLGTPEKKYTLAHYTSLLFSKNHRGTQEASREIDKQENKLWHDETSQCYN